MAPRSKARIYLAAQAAAGALWWLTVLASSDVRGWTLGGLNPVLLVGPDFALFVGASALAAALGHRGWALVAALWTTVATLGLLTYGLVEREAGTGVVLMAIATVATVSAASTLQFGHVPTRWFFVGPFSFREAAAQSPGHHLRRSLRQLVVFWTSLLVVLPLLLGWGERRLRLAWRTLEQPRWAVTGVVVFVTASALGLWSCFSMALRGQGTPLPAATARALVVVGPYRFVRNPMALAGAFQTIGVGLGIGSWIAVVSAGVGALAWNTFIRPVEEADLAVRFGAPYEDYCRRVRCWVPRRPDTVHRSRAE